MLVMTLLVRMKPNLPRMPSCQFPILKWYFIVDAHKFSKHARNNLPQVPNIRILVMYRHGFVRRR